MICISRQPDAAAGTQHRVVLDYRDVDALAAAMEGAEVVVHLAARAHVLDDRPGSADQAFRDANLEGGRSSARAAARAGAHRFVLVSSIGVNGDRTGGRPFSEESPADPREPYAVSKWEAERAIAEVLAETRTDFVVVRPTLVYGPGCPGNFRLLLGLAKRLPVVPLGGLDRPRSLIGVQNLCDALVLAATHPAASRRTYVLSDGEDLSVAEVVRVLVAAMGRSPARVITVPAALLRAAAALIGRGAAVDKLAAELAVDPSAFRRDTGWVAPLAPRDGLGRTARAYANPEAA